MAAFLEGGEPNLNGAARELAARGATRVLVIPYFLTLGLHLQRDLPKLIAQARRKIIIILRVLPGVIPFASRRGDLKSPTHS